VRDETKTQEVRSRSARGAGVVHYPQLHCSPRRRATGGKISWCCFWKHRSRKSSVRVSKPSPLAGCVLCHWHSLCSMPSRCFLPCNYCIYFVSKQLLQLTTVVFFCIFHFVIGRHSHARAGRKGVLPRARRRKWNKKMSSMHSWSYGSSVDDDDHPWLSPQLVGTVGK